MKPRVVHLEPHEDERGSLTELWRGYNPFGQANLTRSKQDVIRGIHYSLVPQAKMITCVEGSISDVAIDLRVGSPTYLQSHSVHLSSENSKAFYIPAGFGHGFLTLSETSTVIYHLSSEHNPNMERALYPLDPNLSVPWSIWNNPRFIMSDRDKSAPWLGDDNLELPGYRSNQ